MRQFRKDLKDFALGGLTTGLVVAALLYGYENTNVCVAVAWDRADTFYCSKGRTDSDYIRHDKMMRSASDDVVYWAQNQGPESVRDLGSYDTCLHIAVKSQRLDKPLMKQFGLPDKSGGFPLYVSWEDYPMYLADACALVLHGGEW